MQTHRSLHAPRSRVRLLRAALPLLLLSPVLGGCSLEIDSEFGEIGSVSKSFDAEATIEAIEVDVRFGELSVQAAQGERVQVIVHLAAKDAVRDRLATTELVFGDHAGVRWEGGRLIVEDFHRDTPEEADWQVSFEVHVPVASARPEGIDVDAKVGAGSVELDYPMLRAVETHVGAGELEIDARSVTGPLDLEIGPGACEIDISDVAPSQDVAIDVGAGDVELRLPDDAQGRFEIQVSVGALSVDSRFAVPVESAFVGASAKGDFGGGGATYRVNVGVGDCSVR